MKKTLLFIVFMFVYSSEDTLQTPQKFDDVCEEKLYWCENSCQKEMSEELEDCIGMCDQNYSDCKEKLVPKQKTQ